MKASVSKGDTISGEVMLLGLTNYNVHAVFFKLLQCMLYNSTIIVVCIFQFIISAFIYISVSCTFMEPVFCKHLDYVENRTFFVFYSC